MTAQRFQVGAPAPDFTLPDQFGRLTTLSCLVSDRAVLLVFFPFAFSGICTGELRELRDDRGRFDNDVVHPVGLSCDPVPSLRAWDDAEAFFFPLLSDFWPHGAVSEAYQVFDPSDGASHRGTFLVDRDLRIRWSSVQDRSSRRDFSAVDLVVGELSRER
ncbi:Peroxiredoxin [Austwickia chelonae]|uniref:Putative peroxiredoxin n=1 Tax=Austwickia chelonae NBRC 105200 TaxID=1184607 RepID=K6ULI7_9MICO|nr:redoxin domain-containing protein [Austwickia chelonae]GAB77281.1 putative peroxiredoxin [Austwickia chelonae NBRC 105200]SEW06881.1 Peroxiredoxin [Austwickia chelonae]